jgi:CRISPR-associated protein Cas1
MTYHIITIQKPGARLSVDRGFLVCRYPDEEAENRIALADVRNLIIGVPSVAFTNECIARLLAQDSLILHCDSHYKPIGWSSSLDRCIRREVFGNQIKQDDEFNKLLWKAIVRQKMENQAALLDSLGVVHNLHRLIAKPLANEANIAKQFWGHYFETLGKKQTRERKGAESFENKALNYGYAVISTLVHRAILIYGLLPSLGIHHDYRYRSHPLVYDLMEPFRSFIDLFLARWMHSLENVPNDDDFRDWTRYLMNGLQCCRIKIPEDKHSRKLVDAVDKSVASVASCFESRNFEARCIEKLWLPKLEHHYWWNDAVGEPDEGTDEEETAVS